MRVEVWVYIRRAGCGLGDGKLSAVIIIPSAMKDA